MQWYIFPLRQWIIEVMQLDCYFTASLSYGYTKCHLGCLISSYSVNAFIFPHENTAICDHHPHMRTFLEIIVMITLTQHHAPVCNGNRQASVHTACRKIYVILLGIFCSKYNFSVFYLCSLKVIEPSLILTMKFRFEVFHVIL